MPKIVFTNAVVQVNGVDLSDHVNQVTLDLSKDQIDVTAMGADAHQWLAGLENDTLTVVYWADFAANEVDATLYPIFSGGTPVAFKVAPNGTAFSSTNPTYSGSVVLFKYQPLNGKVGDGLNTTTTFQVSGTVTRGTS